MSVPRYDIPNPAPESLRLVQGFVNTCDLEHEREWLATPADLSDWLRTNGYDGEATRADLRRAHELRGALRELLVANNAGKPYPSEACQSLARVADRARLTLRFQATREAVLAPRADGVTAALGELVGIVFTTTLDGSFTRLKACRNCRWAFYDYSRNRGASWCSMVLCGNRAKTRRYRAQRKARGRSQ